MQYENRVIDKEKGIVQITTSDERWYRKVKDKTELWIPSVTWICQYYPKGIAYMKWLASHGWDEAEALKEEAGEYGTHAHKAAEMLLKGSVVRFDAVVDDRPLTTQEYAAAMSFVDWFNEYKPVVKKTELTVFSPDDRYAGTLDLYCEIEGEPWIVDFKTSAQIWPSHEIQLSAYKHAHNPEARIGVVQLGYKYNKKKKWKFTEIEDQFDLFNASYRIWQKECAGISPLQRDYPLELTLKLKEENNEAA
ncbi:MAG: hypothetical protein WC373_17735 [Smithella sp.]